VTDVGISGGAPSAPSSAPSAPVPSQGEVPVDTSPVHTPHPVGSQAPQKPASSDPPPSRREQTREAIRKAFERTSEPPKAAGSQMGHNQPPDDKRLEKERVKTPPLDLKKPPSEQPQVRGEHGHFAARAQSPRSAPGQPQPGQPGSGQAAPPATWNIVQLPEGAPHRNPPRRWGRQAQAEWAAAPESVRASVSRMNNEFSQAYGRMRGDHEEMNRIRRFHDMATQHGTTLEKALHNYVSMEQKLRDDPVSGLDVIVSNLNLRTPDGQRLGLRDVAWHVLNLTPEQHQLTQSQNSQTAQAQMLAQLRQQQEAIAHGLHQLHYERRFTHMRGQVDRFAETHPRLDELGRVIERELRFGFDLETAYRRADALYPTTTPAAQTRAPSAQTRSATDRSIHGAPSVSNSSGNGMSSGKRRRGDAPPSRRDSISRAIARVNGSSN
jgi:hypothetical protein